MESAAADHASTRRTNKSEARKTIPGFLCFMGAFGGIRTRVYTRPQGRESNKDSRPVWSAVDSHEGMRAGGLSITASCKRGIGLPASVGACPL